MNILLTGGAGYIGSHTLVELLEAAHNVTVLDNLSNGSKASLQRVEQLTGQKIHFIEADIRHKNQLQKIFQEYSFDAVMHFAGLKAVGESTEKPFLYFENNITGTLNLLNAMSDAGIYTFIFSSSATVYGNPTTLPMTEDTPVSQPQNPYGYSKLAVEQILQQLHTANSQWNIAILRYFNPIGAHESGLIGEAPNNIPNNLMPYISQVAVGKLPHLSVYGDDYDTHDGTGVRDYIHVVDLAKGHLAALEYITQHSGLGIWNLGTGKGYSVLDMVKAFEKSSATKIDYKIQARRPGDIDAYYADTQKASKELGWKAQHNLTKMMDDTWRWQSQNPNGYSK